MTSSPASCVRCQSTEQPLRATLRWGVVCPPCHELHSATYRSRSTAEKVGIGIVLAGLAIWALFLLLVVLNLIS